MSDKKSKATTSENQEPMKPAWKENLDRAREKSQAAQEAEKRRAPLKPPQEQSSPLEQGVLPGVPWTPPGTSPMSNQLAKTPVFAPIRRGRRAVHDKSKLPAPTGYALWYSGKQLDVGDQDTYLTAIMLAKGLPHDKPVIIERAEFLKLMGRKPGGSSYKWLQESFDRVSSGRIYYDTPEKVGNTPLIGPLEYDKTTEKFFFTVPAAALRVFGFQDFGYVDMEKRRMISNKAELAKWLQCYAVSNGKGEHRASLDNLQNWSGYEGRARDFRGYLAEALKELKKVGVIGSWELYERKKKVKWTR